MSGADLETHSGAASKVIDELLNITQTDNVEIYMEVGGSASWANHEIRTDCVSRYQIKENRLVLLEQFQSCNMGEAGTLREYAHFASTVEAERKVFLFWGHGSSYGICPDAMYDNDSLSYSEIREAFTDSFFDMIIFNACYTSNLDLMTFICNYAEYAIASEEVFPSLGYDYTAMIKAFSDNQSMDMESIGKKVIDDTLYKYKNSSLRDSLTLSLIDLYELKKWQSAIDQYFYEMLYNNSDDSFRLWLKSVTDTNTVGYAGKDMLDMDEHFSKNQSVLTIALNDIIKYEIHGTRYDTSGMYLYYKPRLSSVDFTKYSSNSIYSSYFSLLKHRDAFASGKYITVVHSSNISDENVLYEVVLDEMTPHYASLFYYEFYDEKGNIIKQDKVGLWSEYDDTTSYSLVNINTSTLFELSFGGECLKYRFVSIQEDANTDFTKIIYKAPIAVNGQNGEMYFSYEYRQNSAEDVTGFGYDGVYAIMGFVPIVDGDGLYMQELTDGDVLQLNAQEFIYRDHVIERVPICSAVNASIIIKDIFGNEYSSPIFALS